VEAHQVGLALVPASTVDSVRHRDAYQEAMEDVVGRDGRGAWLQSQLRADLINGMTEKERKRRRFHLVV
jgi:hypothetical protein